MRHPILAIDLGGVLLHDPTRGNFWRNIARGDEQLAAAARHRWLAELRTPFETGHLSENEVWGALSLITRLKPEDIRSQFLGGFTEINLGISALRSFSSTGGRTVLATNHYAPWLDIWNRKFAWFRKIDYIACSSEMGYRKPDERYFVELLEIVNAPVESVIFVDDDLTNIESAQSLNIESLYADGSDAWVRSLGLANEDTSHG
ncbi:HAD family hydrolase [Gordonia sp. ABKF26]|uniref:HAD family hydrolase n=1 Tax=Gordonia sp. ABKF26 TaxID=3238687 RepID=UPI0034E4D076